MEDFKPDLHARSEWATLHDVEVAEVSPANHPVNGRIRVPGSKSWTNRALIIAAMAEGTSRLSGVLKSDDTYWCIHTLRQLGVLVEIDGDEVIIEGVGGDWLNKDETLYIGSAGTTARFLPGLLAASQGGHWTMEGSTSMSKRPMATLITALQELGAQIKYSGEEGFLPIQIEGKGIHGGVVHISGKTSSQFISGLLIASSYAKEPVTIHVVDHIVQHAYVKITLDLMEQFGAHVEYDDSLTTIKVYPKAYKSRDIQLEADASTVNYFFALAALTNGKVRVDNLSYDTLQPDIQFVDVLERMGCTVVKGDGFLELRGTAQLKGNFDISMREMSDQTLTLAAIAPFADGPISIHEVAHIRKHESDRIGVMAECLTKMGIRVGEREDGLTVYPGNPLPAECNSYDDHRVAMSLALMGAKVPGVRILDPGCISKTCPTFFEEIEKLGLLVCLEEKSKKTH
ncbi:3-phosphoshikimate 1-carboxyvinyltransferase [Thermoactinomyces sp. DSM 45892]|uniref:3-phosphoshikimate 1-carboxyvinyltransferase n=1 Tax=Thermoactinomyces sp. DSM 45892 TaxID=1882753 RepID=UPI0008987436|nr:3-phosphoshikimate 1-carboxyvinyltransferase [Thermoactinomyces sp. DSM 45892]SDZ24064.1 3-phosphoshikimate 1-carboxyvinyltransferase [Thermoactinomyces sp. DSM 45892]